MITEQSHNNDISFKCTKFCPDGTESDDCHKKQKFASYNINMIPGSGKLTEYPKDCRDKKKKYYGLDDDYDDDSLCGFDNIWCPRVCPKKNICINECCEFLAAASLNFINGDLIICDPSTPINMPKLCRNPKLIAEQDALDIFPNLLGVNGSIYIVGTSYIRITGFEKLRFVAGSIVIANNSDLTQIPAFSSLLNVSSKVVCTKDRQDPNKCINARCERGAIIIANNSCLRKITGFDCLRQVKDGIVISQNACLTHICGFMYLYRTKRVVIYGNPKLQKVIGFCHTDTLNKGLYILNNNRAGEFDLTIHAFLCLETAKNVIVIGNNYLKKFSLDCLQTVCENFIIRSNSKLEELLSGYGDCTGCNKEDNLIPGLKYVGNLIIENNPDLQWIKFPALNEVNGKLNISGNCSLQCLDCFNKLKRVFKGIVIADNAQLKVIKGFNQVKYLGSHCICKTGANKKCSSCCGCVADLDIDWTCCRDGPVLQPCNRLAGCTGATSPVKPGCLKEPVYCPDNRGIRKLIGSIDCTGDVTGPDCCICDNFPAKHYDIAGKFCAYRLPDDFFRLVCEPESDCCECDPNEDADMVDLVNASLVIFRNCRLKCIGGFASLKHVEAGIYIVFNVSLHTINAFGQLAFALDIWIRNNSSLKYIIGFDRLLAVRDLTLLDSSCLNNWSSLKSLEFAQRIALEAKTSKSIELKHIIPSVKGTFAYFFIGKKHKHDPDDKCNDYTK